MAKCGWKRVGLKVRRQHRDDERSQGLKKGGGHDAVAEGFYGTIDTTAAYKTFFSLVVRK